MAPVNLFTANRPLGEVSSEDLDIFMTAKEKKIEDDGRVVETLPDAVFKVELDSGEEVLAHISGKMRKFRIRVVVGDRVKVERSPYDPTRGRIVRRYN